jgi:DNA-binding transcriptional LysR family regulator
MTGGLDPRALRAYCSIAEHGSLTRAAAALGVAQSVLSRRLAILEREIGGRLFHRTGRGAQLTDLGIRLLSRAQSVLSDCQALIDEGRGDRSSPAGTVDIGMVPAASRPLLSPLIARLLREFPRIHLRAIEGYSGTVEEWLASGRIDVGLFNRYGRGARPGAELFLRADVVIVMPRHRFALPGSDVPFRALHELPLVLPPRPNSLVSALSDLAAKHGVTLDIVLEAGSSAMIHDAVASGGLCTLVPRHLAEHDYARDNCTVARLVKPALHQTTWLAYTTQRPTSVAARVVGRLIRELAPAPPQ